MNYIFLTRLFLVELLLITLSIISAEGLFGQGVISGTSYDEEGPIELSAIAIDGTHLGAITNIKGLYKIKNVPYGIYAVTASFLGYESVMQNVTIDEDNTEVNLDFRFTEKTLILDAIVVSATKTFKRQTNSPVIVSVLNSKALENVQACNLSEGLKFQSGLRVETDCQTCNYTQLRMNGLAGGYSQILVNGRPIFSPLTGLYGMEQLPVNMIERIEVIRGGGSSLYGSSAIGGTVNVITKIPKKNSYEINYNYQNINGQTSDNQLMANATILQDNKNSGVSFFLNRRERGLYDHNEDNFSEIPLIENTSLGVNAFILPTDDQKLEFSISQLNEYRYGGEMVDKVAFLTQQSEERTHNVWMVSADYQINFNNNKSSFISYLAWQNTSRDHYTGIIP
ncbi:MAG: TonB-dependent receptor plug domain-containing protein, partial [Saprospiraceae bacterium]|nr:TonB-dependent receptor plug domain-containing protein [Saprospiraceae bacterium]